jgi:hypothetical protein
MPHANRWSLSYEHNLKDVAVGRDHMNLMPFNISSVITCFIAWWILTLMKQASWWDLHSLKYGKFELMTDYLHEIICRHVLPFFSSKCCTHYIFTCLLYSKSQTKGAVNFNDDNTKERVCNYVKTMMVLPGLWEVLLQWLSLLLFFAKDHCPINIWLISAVIFRICRRVPGHHCLKACFHRIYFTRVPNLFSQSVVGSKKLELHIFGVIIL